MSASIQLTPDKSVFRDFKSHIMTFCTHHTYELQFIATCCTGTESPRLLTLVVHHVAVAGLPSRCAWHCAGTACRQLFFPASVDSISVLLWVTNSLQQLHQHEPDGFYLPQSLGMLPVILLCQLPLHA